MPKESSNFEQRTFVESGREILKGGLTPQQLKAIVSQFSDEERPRFHKLFTGLSESTKPQPEADTKVASAVEHIVIDTEESGKKQVQEKLSPKLTAQLEQAETLFGADFMGPKQYKKAFGFMPAPEQIPAILFSQERLERAKAMGMMLVLHADKVSDGEPMTMNKMNTMQKAEERNDRVLYNTDWYSGENFYTQEAPRLSWRLVSKGILPDSTSKTEVEQMELIVQTLQNSVFAGMEIPRDYQAAIDEFESQKTAITKYMESDNEWQKASEMIEALALSKLTRGTPAEIIQTIEMCHQNTGEYLFPNVYVRTPRRDSLGRLVSVGDALADGVLVWGDEPGSRNSSIGVSLSLQS